MSLLMIPDIIHYITIFTTLHTTINLAMTNKLNYKIITADNRFIALKLMLIVHRYNRYINISDENICCFIVLLKLNRYNYYKIAADNTIWIKFGNMAIYNDGLQFYQTLAADKTVINRPAFNSLYCRQYYNNKRSYRADIIKIYQLKLSEILKYKNNSNYTEPVFKNLVVYLSRDLPAQFNDPEFADKLVFLKFSYLHAKPLRSVMIFEYDNDRCIIDKQVDPGKLHICTYINGEINNFNIVWYGRKESAEIELISYFISVFNLDYKTTKQFVKFIFNYMI